MGLHLRSFVGVVLLLFVSLVGNTRVIYVDASNTIMDGNGVSWELAFSNLDSALLTAQYGDQVWVAKGTYYPSLNGSSRTSTFIVNKGVSLYGGFSGNENSLFERVLDTNPTILSGDIGVKGDSLDNCFSVLYIVDPDEYNVLDGFIIEKGVANDQTVGMPFDSPNKCGGGVYVLAEGSNSSVTIDNCIFRYNSSLQLGGALYLGSRGDYRITPKLINCRFDRNIAFSGGAICYDRGLENVDTLLWKCLFFSNSAQYGGAITVSQAVATEVNLSNCKFGENSGTRGSVVRFEYPANPISIELLNLELENNVNLNQSGAIEVVGISDKIDLILDSCIIKNQFEIRDNLDTTGGRGIVASNYENLKLQILNSTFSSAGIRLYRGRGSVKIINSSINKCIGHDDVLSLLVDSVFLGNVNISDNNSLRPLINSPIYLRVLNATLSNNYTVNANESESVIIAADQIWLQNSIIWGNDKDTSVSIVARMFTAKQVLTDFGNFSNVKMLSQFGTFIEPEMVQYDSILFASNPLFKDAGSGDYHVSSCSPAVNSGSSTATVAANLVKDIESRERVVGNSVDLGPYEHQSPFEISLEILQHVSCKGSADGAIDFAVSGVEPIVSYWMSDGNIGTNTTDLGEGDYVFMFEDSDNCKDTISVSVEEPDSLLARVSTTDVICFGTSSGEAQLNISGGTPPYTSIWSNGQVGLQLTNALAGNYTATVRDSNGCEILVPLILFENPSIEINLVTSSPTSNLTRDGVIQVSDIWGGIPPYLVVWENGFNGFIRDSLFSGTYILSVFDSAECMVQYEVVLDPIKFIDTSEAIFIFPNPLNRNGKLGIRLISKTEYVLTINTFDILGKAVPNLNMIEEVFVGVNDFVYDADLPYGVYILYLSDNSQMISSFKFIVTSD